MEINKVDSNMTIEKARAAREQAAQQATRVTEQEGEAKDVRTNAVSAPPPGGRPSGGQGGGTGAPNRGEAAQAQAATAQLTTTTTEEDDDASYQTIVAKANSGQSLTADELNTLRSRNPALYAKVAQANNTREELRTQMEADPSRAGQAAREALHSLSNESDEIGAMMREAVREEYSQFAAKYDQVLFGTAE